jgi:hypothetical protein
MSLEQFQAKQTGGGRFSREVVARLSRTGLSGRGHHGAGRR